MPLSKFNFSKSWITNPRGQEDSYKKKKLSKGQVNDTKFDYDKKGLTSAIEYANKLMREKKPVNFKWHDKEYEKSITKEGGADGGGFGDGGGTVAVSTDSGFFTPTYGGKKERRKAKKKKRTGIHRLADFLNDDSPERKMVKKSHIPTSLTLELVNWVSKELKKGDIKFTQQTSGETINNQPPRIDWAKKQENESDDGIDDVTEFDAKPDKNVVIEQKDMERKIRNLDDNEDIKDNKPDEKGDANIAAPAGLNIQLEYGSGSERGALVTGGARDTTRGVVEELDEETEELPFEKILGKDLSRKLFGG